MSRPLTHWQRRIRVFHRWWSNAVWRFLENFNPNIAAVVLRIYGKPVRVCEKRQKVTYTHTGRVTNNERTTAEHS